MDRIRWILAVLFLVSFGAFGGGCASGDAAGGTYDDGPRKVLASPDEVANGNDFLNVAVNYVSYIDPKGDAIADEASVRKMLAKITSVWSQCGIGLGLARYQAITPSALSEPYSPGYYSEIDRVRKKLQNAGYLLVIASGPWVRNGSLGTANCYSSFPGDGADGIVCERKTALNGMLMAHEVGHWFDLRHTNNPDNDYVDDTTWKNVDFNLMGNIVARDDDELTPGQCERARRSIAEWRREAVLD